MEDKMSYERNRRLALGLLQDSANLARVARDTGIPYQTIYSFSKMDPKDSLNWRWDLIAERILRVRCPEKLDNTKPLDEAETLGWVKDYFLNHISAENRKISESRLWDIQDNFGIPVTRHPSWHPLSFEFDNPEVGEHDCWRFGHLDHTRYFVNAILTCPYGEGREILAKVKELQEAQRPEGYEWKYTLKATPLEEKLYSEDANPILIKASPPAG